MGVCSHIPPIIKMPVQEKRFIAKIIRREGCLYFVDGEGIVWEKKLNRGLNKKARETINKKREEKYF